MEKNPLFEQITDLLAKLGFALDNVSFLRAVNLVYFTPTVGDKPRPYLVRVSLYQANDFRVQVLHFSGGCGLVTECRVNAAENVPNITTMFRALHYAPAVNFHRLTILDALTQTEV